MSKTLKISDDNFWQILSDNAGIYQRTALAISKAIDGTYTRQSVYERANKDKARLHGIREANIDIAESGLMTLMRQPDNPNIRFAAIRYFLSTQGRHRGYTEQKDLTMLNIPKIIIEYKHGGEQDSDDKDILS